MRDTTGAAPTDLERAGHARAARGRAMAARALQLAGLALAVRGARAVDCHIDSPMAAPPNGNYGVCATKLDFNVGEGCTLSCDAGFEVRGDDPVCAALNDFQNLGTQRCAAAGSCPPGSQPAAWAVGFPGEIPCEACAMFGPTHYSDDGLECKECCFGDVSPDSCTITWERDACEGSSAYNGVPGICDSGFYHRGAYGENLRCIGTPYVENEGFVCMKCDPVDDACLDCSVPGRTKLKSGWAFGQEGKAFRCPGDDRFEICPEQVLDYDEWGQPVFELTFPGEADGRVPAGDPRFSDDVGEDVLASDEAERRRHTLQCP